jgi:undecaprenyl-phosphate galactose phosphotransferase
MKRVTFRAVEVLALLVSDVSVVWFAVIAGYFIRVELLTGLFGSLTSTPVPLSFYLDHYYLSVLWPLLFAYEGLYTRRLPLSEETKRIWKGSTIAMVLAIVVLFYFKRSFIFSRIILLLAWGIILVLLPWVRTAMRRLLSFGPFFERGVLLVGGGEGVSLLLRSLKRNRTLGYTPCGILDDTLPEATEVEGVPVLGSTGDLERELERRRVDAVILALESFSGDRLTRLAGDCERRVRDVLIAPDFLGMRVSGLEVERFDSGILLKFRNDLLRPVNAAVKRLFDMVLGSIATLVCGPILGLCALCIRLDSNGPVLFVQDRRGRDGRIFRCLKFRTMYLDSDRRLDEHLKDHPESRSEWETYKKLKSGDPRVTWVGRFLRRFSLDELPQLFNVLRGDMSLVGPRPYLPEEAEDSEERMSVINRVRPGITGFWQVSGRSEVSFRERTLLEEFYVRNWSLWLDFMIILRTLVSVIRKEGAY